jgi:hypothetical protein
MTVKKTLKRLSINDYVKFKNDPYSIYKVVFINYLDDKISLQLIHPILPQGYRIGSYSLSNSVLVKIEETDTVSVLYD